MTPIGDLDLPHLEDLVLNLLLFGLDLFPFKLFLDLVVALVSLAYTILLINTLLDYRFSTEYELASQTHTAS